MRPSRNQVRFAIVSRWPLTSRNALIRLLAPLTFAALLFGCTPNYTLIAPSLTACDPSAAPAGSLRVASYNLKSGLETSLDQVAAAIEQLSPDIIALQEVDRFVDRSGRVDQAKVLADRLGYQEIYAAAIDRGGGSYGIALLSRLPVASVERVNLRAAGSYEPRVAIDAQVCVGPQVLRVVATHADVLAATANLAALAEKLAPGVGQGVILLGDLNEKPTGSGPKRLRGAGFLDVIGAKAEGVSFWPNQTRIDYLFVDSPLSDHAVAAGIEQNKASDHYPVYVDFDLKNGWTPTL